MSGNTDIFEKLKSGAAVDMMSKEYEPAIRELNRANLALYYLNHTEPLPEKMKEGF